MNVSLELRKELEILKYDQNSPSERKSEYSTSPIFFRVQQYLEPWTERYVRF